MWDHAFPDGAFPAIVAHRGASSTRPENTLGAFDEAVRLGADILEMDVRLTRDGVAILMHDETVDRTTDGRGAVLDLDASEIARLDAGTADAPERVPALVDVLDLVNGRAGVALEMKHLPWERGYDATSRRALVNAAHIDLERTAFAGPVLLVSFDVEAIDDSKAIASDVPTGLLSTEILPPADALSLASGRGHDMVLPGTRALIPAGRAFVDAVHAAELRVGTWTVDDPEEVRRLLGWGVDIVASNDPAMARAVLGEFRAG